MNSMSHHALVTFGAALEDVVRYVTSQLPEAELYQESYDRLKIESVRSLTERAHMRPNHGTSVLFVLECGSITRESQNALLKLLEEPPATSRFVLVLPEGAELLPTLSSRLQKLEIGGQPAATNELFTEFLSQPYAERLEAIASKTKNKDRQWIAAIRNGLVSHVATKASGKEVQQATLLLEQYGDSPGASVKMLLEHVALSLPTKTV